MAKNYISNSEESIRMFKSNLMESLSKVHFAVPLFIFVPAIFIFIYKAFSAGVSLLNFGVYFMIGLGVWTLTEYVMHRFIFHYHPTSEFGKKLHFIFHGVHHDYPRDKKRLVLPPSVSIPLASLFYFIFSTFLAHQLLFAFFPGFLLGYLIYDMLHYAMHHHNFKTGIMKRIKQHHMLHHYQDPNKGYGVSSSLWDIILGSGFIKESKKVNAKEQESILSKEML
jgi:sterol desaturase/sphingolipid hydroxylase (fatty acid hydroxylase superfamily)